MKNSAPQPYVTPKVTDHGDLLALTASANMGGFVTAATVTTITCPIGQKPNGNGTQCIKA